MESVGAMGRPAPPGEVGREFLLEVLDALDIGSEVEVELMEDGTWRRDIAGEDAGQTIGHDGDTINALQYLATLVTQRRTGEHVRLLLDAEGYRERRQAALVEQARVFAEEVKN